MGRCDKRDEMKDEMLVRFRTTDFCRLAANLPPVERGRGCADRFPSSLHPHRTFIVLLSLKHPWARISPGPPSRSITPGRHGSSSTRTVSLSGCLPLLSPPLPDPLVHLFLWPAWPVPLFRPLPRPSSWPERAPFSSNRAVAHSTRGQHNGQKGKQASKEGHAHTGSATIPGPGS